MVSSSEGGILSGHGPLDTAISQFLVQAVIIIGLTRVLSVILNKLQQPRVIAEVLGGIILGPSALGQIPGFTKTFFPPGPSRDLLGVVANFGLVLYLFLVGLELDPSVMKRNAKRSMLISLAGMGLPFLLGVGASFVMYGHLSVPEAERPPFGSFLLFTGVAMSITAFPVLARILTEKSLLHTSVGLMTISAAAVDDAMAWSMLALVIAILNSTSNLIALYIFLLILAYAALLMFAVRPLYLRLIDYVLIRESSSLNHFLLAFTFICIFISAWITELIGVHAIFGGFLFGLIIPQENGFSIMITEKMEDMVLIIFLPLYFALSGLKTQLGTLNDPTSWGLVFLVILVACAGKIVGCTGAAKLVGMNWRESFTIGVLMNTKGLVELIVLNIGLDANVIDNRIFAIMVIMALMTTFITSPVVEYIYPLKFRETFQEEENEKNSVQELTSTVPKSNFRLCLSLLNMEDVSTLSVILPFLQSPNGMDVELHCSRLRENFELSSNLILAIRTTSVNGVILDPVLKMMSIFGELLKINVVPHISVVSYDGYVNELMLLADEESLNMILLPYRKHKNSAFVTSGLEYVVSEVIKQSKCPIGICVDLNRPTVYRRPEKYRVLIPFIGGPSQQAAVSFGIQLMCNPKTEVTILFIKSEKLTEEMVEVQKLVQKKNKKGLGQIVITETAAKDSKQIVDVIVETCKASKYELILMGYHCQESSSSHSSRPQSIVPSVFGSTAEQLMDQLTQIAMIAFNAEYCNFGLAPSLSNASLESVL